MNIQFVERGKRLKEARQKAGIGQMELEKATGIKQSNISRFERGVYDIPATLLVYLHDVHDININYVLFNKYPIRNNERLIRKVKDE